MPRTFIKPALMTWGGFKISDHNRSPLSIAVDRIEEATRMANGTMRKFIVADKRTFSTDWTELPQTAALTVDGFWGKNEIENWYNTNAGSFPLVVHYGDGTIDTYTVFMSKFSAEISKRGAFDFWRVTVEMQEV